MCGDCLAHAGQPAAIGAETTGEPVTVDAVAASENGSGFLLEDADPRARLILALVFAFVLAAVQSVEAAVLGLAFSILITMASGKPLLALLKRLAVVNTFIIFMWVMLPFSFSTPGEIIAKIGPLEVTREGVILASLLTLKANAILLVVISLLTVGPLHLMAEASRALGMPDKLVNLFLLTTRYFQVIFDEYQRLRLAMKARGFKSSLSRHSMKSLGSLLGILLVRSFDRADRIHKAMLARGYSGDLHVRTEFEFKKIDAIFALSMIVVTIVVLIAEWNRTL
ncbi:MAG: cobalt ECF transporter T component CbiQ [Deltaproteobacteria bacterium]|jgi:cobalt/nickel transport system permease protein|nr:cobalt ECF transporter T component CbiQ [Deltaproteobacteria bacterium]